MIKSVHGIGVRCRFEFQRLNPVYNVVPKDNTNDVILLDIVKISRYPILKAYM